MTMRIHEGSTLFVGTTVYQNGAVLDITGGVVSCGVTKKGTTITGSAQITDAAGGRIVSQFAAGAIPLGEGWRFEVRLQLGLEDQIVDEGFIDVAPSGI